MANGLDAVPGLLDAIELVDNAIAMTEGALADNPTKEEERSLRRALLRLNAERAALEAELDAALAADTSVRGPSDTQVTEIGLLLEAVETARNQATAVSARIALASKVLALATTAIAPAKKKPA